MPIAAKSEGHGPARGKRLPWFIRRTARRPATMFSHDAKASRMRDRAADSLCVQPEFSAPAPKRKGLPLHTALPRRFESATMQRHSTDPESGQKPDSYDEAPYRALLRAENGRARCRESGCRSV